MATKPFDAGEIVRRLEFETFEDMGETAFAIVRNLIFRSPVGNPTRWKNPDSAPAGYVGGHFRRNWLVSIGTVNTAEIEGVDRSGAPTLAAALEKIRSAEKARASTLIIQNNVPYANRLALGHSKVAPAGWVDEEINNALSIPGGVVDLG